MTRINLATEDELSETVALRLVSELLPEFEVGLRLRKGGNGYLRSSFTKFRKMSRREFVLLITDLDRVDCAPTLLRSWTNGEELPDRFVFRVCVREIESWILADRVGFARLIGVNRAIIPRNPDDLDDPKRSLLQIARRGHNSIRQELLAVRGTVASQGLGYNRTLCAFAETDWSLDRARANSASLQRAVRSLAALA